MAKGAPVCDGDRVLGQTQATCKDGRTLVSAAGKYHWFDGEVARAGAVPVAVRDACLG